MKRMRILMHPEKAKGVGAADDSESYPLVKSIEKTYSKLSEVKKTLRLIGERLAIVSFHMKN